MCGGVTLGKGKSGMKEEKLKELLKNMSLKDKAGQLVQLTGNCFTTADAETGPAADLGIPQDMVYRTGSILNVVGADKLKEVQDQYLEKNPPKIPMLFMADVINGFRTIMPIPLGQGCSFDPELVQEAAQVAAKEASSAGVQVTFSPMVDLVRDARWGRVMESTGEDPCLNSAMGLAMVRGYQGEGLDQPGTVASCVKHFAVYGAPEAGRDYNLVDMSEKRLREEYLPAYETAIKEGGAAMVMTSFNSLNGIPATGNSWLMQDLLRKEWGFEGTLITDYAAIFELLNHGVVKDKREASAMAMKCGVDIDMVTDCYANELEKLVQDGVISREALDEAVYRVLKLKNDLGLFENPIRYADKQLEEKLCCCEEHRTVSRKLAQESCVLLKNKGILPLKKAGQKVALMGALADSQEICGAWSLFYKPEEVVTLKQGMEAKAPLCSTSWGCDMLDAWPKWISFANTEFCGREDQSDSIQEAVQKAKEADVVVMTLGELAQQTGEGTSRGNLELADCQKQLFDAVYQVNPHIVVVLFTGRPLDIRYIDGRAEAILVAWQPGTEGGNAIADLLYGDAEPSGKLSMSFPYCTGQEPVYYAHYRTGRPATRGVKQRFCSSYQDIPNEPLYPFGYGLGYTTFEISVPEVDKAEFAAGDSLQVNATVKNTGDRAGCEVVQLYVKDCVSSTERPVKELKGFERVELKPGESRKVSFTLSEKDFAFFRVDGTWGMEAGEFELYVGSDSDTENKIQVCCRN